MDSFNEDKIFRQKKFQFIQEGCRLVVEEKLGIISNQRKQRDSLNSIFG